MLSQERESLDQINSRKKFEPIFFDIIIVGTEARLPTVSEYDYFESALSRYLIYELSKQEVNIGAVKVDHNQSKVKERQVQDSFTKSGQSRSLTILSPQSISELSMTVSLEGSFSTALVRDLSEIASLVKHTINDGSTGIVQNLLYLSTSDDAKWYYRGVLRVLCTSFNLEKPSYHGAFRVNGYENSYQGAPEKDEAVRYDPDNIEQDTSIEVVGRSPLPITIDVRALHYRNVFGLILLSLCSMFFLMNVIRIGRKKHENRKMRINLAKQAFEGPKLGLKSRTKGGSSEAYGPREKYTGTMDDGAITEKGEYMMESGIPA